MTTTKQAQEDREYVRRLLRGKLPEFAAMLALAERRLDHELSHQTPGRSRAVSRTHNAFRRPLCLARERSP